MNKKYIEALQSVINDDLTSTVYAESVQKVDGNVYFMFAEKRERTLVVFVKDEKELSGFDVKESEKVDGGVVAIMDRTHKNRLALAEIFNWMHPVARFDYDYSFGLGDRLGLASNAHLKLFRGKGVLPVLAQQSIRELNLTKRTFSDVMDSAAWAIFEEGYTDGFSADGDHLKNPFEVEYAVQCGFPMITLDCSEYINNDVDNYDDAKLKTEYNKLSEESRKAYEAKYLNKTFEITGGVTVEFDEREYMKTVLIFSDAIDFAILMHEQFVVPNNLDFEVSIDETIVPTTPANHFFIANEFAENKVVVETMAPKFHGEFQKGIDYRGNLDQFTSEYKVHEAIAKHFNYRLSIHSGSDKFMIFPVVSEYSKEGWHVKTAGTNWLEALKVIAKNDPKLMLEIYKYALDHLDEAKAYYVIDGTVENSLAFNSLTEENVMDTLVDEMSRQVLHVTYGLILNEKVNHEYVFKNRIYEVLETHIDDYNTFLNTHINKHLELLGK